MYQSISLPSQQLTFYCMLSSDHPTKLTHSTCISILYPPLELLACSDGIPTSRYRYKDAVNLGQEVVEISKGMWEAGDSRISTFQLSHQRSGSKLIIIPTFDVTYTCSVICQ